MIIYSNFRKRDVNKRIEGGGNGVWNLVLVRRSLVCLFFSFFLSPCPSSSALNTIQITLQFRAIDDFGNVTLPQLSPSESRSSGTTVTPSPLSEAPSIGPAGGSSGSESNEAFSFEGKCLILFCFTGNLPSSLPHTVLCELNFVCSLSFYFCFFFVVLLHYLFTSFHFCLCLRAVSHDYDD